MVNVRTMTAPKYVFWMSFTGSQFVILSAHVPEEKSGAKQWLISDVAKNVGKLTYT